ncbi:LytR/AlgR family response regulator transcription factor [Undibacterium sp. TJN25]|uniref:LytR/AlgR family response regulator transcription factor n=1 Tax=Undibacterium sp. TJN25 TaxID=3413056 RepID=UPI003BF2DF0B
MSAPLQVLIVDDEVHARTNLRLALLALPGWELAGECSSAAAARACMASSHVDVLLLDVQMPLESGLELARELSGLDSLPLVVFVTAHRGHALDAFDVHALDYIVKPVDERRLQQALERASVLLGQRAIYAQALRKFTDPAPGYWSELVVRSVGRIDRVALADVQWIETAGNYVELHLPQRSLLHRSTLTELARYLDPREFLRIHRRILVQRSQMLGVRQIQEGSYVLILQNGHSLPVSERYIAAAKAALHDQRRSIPLVQ